MAVKETDPLRQWRPIGLGLLVGLMVFCLSEVLIQLESDREKAAERSRLQTEASAMRARLESELNSTFSIGLAAASLVSAKPDFARHDYERLAQSLAAWHPGLRNIALAPDNTVRYVYPLVGNEAVLGVNLEAVPDQREGVLQVRQQWKPMIAGPVNLVQGGVGLVHRVPVIVVDERGQPGYWGLVSVALEAAPVFQRAGLHNTGDIRYALRGRDGKGEVGEVFFGRADVFTAASAIKMNVLMPGGSWQLAADWQAQGRVLPWRLLLWHGLAVLLSLAAAGLVAFAARSQARLHVLASHDTLTGLANRHQFLVQAEAFLALSARRKYPFTLLNMDLEGFKGINDDYGHEVGDAMLAHVATQLRTCLRASDLIARFGGDEFLILLPDTQPGPVLDQLIARLRESVAKPLAIRGNILSVGASVGIATYPDDGFNLADLMRVSDFNMYADKRLRKTEAGLG